MSISATIRGLTITLTHLNTFNQAAHCPMPPRAAPRGVAFADERGWGGAKGKQGQVGAALTGRLGTPVPPPSWLAEATSTNDANS